MLKNYLKIALRNLVKSKGYSFINIGGLAVGMAVAMIIGLWVYDEFSYNRYHENYNRIAKVIETGVFEGRVYDGGEHTSYPLGKYLREHHKDDFDYVIQSSWIDAHILAYKDNKFTKNGAYMSAEAPRLFTLHMLSGTRDGLKEPNSIIIAESVAKALFGKENPMDKIVKLDNRLDVKVTGVYEDLPFNTEFRELTFLAPWDLYEATQNWVQTARDEEQWNNNSWQLLVQIRPNATFEGVSEKIKSIKMQHTPEARFLNPRNYLLPMSEWHLKGTWDDRGQPDGRIRYVWLFGIIGAFVLLLASINFMNLSTARSEKRAKEVGIRKAIGSLRAQLINQFFSESFMVVFLAFIFAIVIVAFALPAFNELAGKQMTFPWTNGYFWLAGFAFCFLTGLLSGSYPALYLSSFQPVKVLKGTFNAGRFAAMPRKVLVVLQFTVSVTLIIGTAIVYKQIQHAKNRPVGYDRNGLITVEINTPELSSQYNRLRSELLGTGAVVEMSTSSSPSTFLGSNNGGFSWPGKDPNFHDNFGTIGVSHDFGKTVGWQFIGGRDFSRKFSTDSLGMVMNESALKYMGFKEPSEVIGQTVKWGENPYKVVGVIHDMVMSSPFSPVHPTLFMVNYGWANVINVKLKPGLPIRESLDKVAAVFREVNPGSPFDYKFTDQEYALKFAAEERIATLATVFAGLAIFISCLGLFGLASFTAEQRTKEIGVRKVLGASIGNLWALLSREFVILVIISFLISIPTAWYFLNNWLQKYEYRTEITWWIFVAAGAGALVVTLATVSYQAIRAALLDPVKSLRSE
ncbi:ABC transporter permease [Dyadobacter endophyticus]|uniref:ABC transporter permease n=1 Tax=Dyadobacter endophyticus TaxID=1749036 RepID=A0ABQ1YV23_9BACT|nr:ABC transporter permease [Dyadobacter endophyticus]GGH38792.1 ABC transporter permease [Dyadobacter endophyticus]